MTANEELDELARERDELKEELAEREKQIVLLREALEAMVSFARAEGKGLRIADEALDSTNDLSNCILCEAEPVRHIYKFLDYAGRTIFSSNLEYEGQTPLETIPLYQARKAK